MLSIGMPPPHGQRTASSKLMVSLSWKSAFGLATTSTFDLENLFSNAQSHYEHLCQVSLKSVH